MNLFSIDEDDYYVFSSKRQNITTFWGTFFTHFGTFTVGTSVGNAPSIRFEQSDMESVREIRKPFPRIARLLQTGTRIPLYLEVIYGPHGTSSGSIVWPDVRSSLQTRLRALFDDVRRVKAWGYHDTEGLLVSEKWLEGGSRVIRRATTSGGRCTSLLDDIMRTVSTSGASAEELDRVHRIVRQACMFTDDSLHFQPKPEMPQPSISGPNEQWNVGNVLDVVNVAEKAIRDTVSSYANATDPWEKQISASKEQMERLLQELERVVKYDADFVYVIPSITSPESKVWQSTFFFE